MKTLRFQSKIDTWLAVVLVAAAGATFWGSVQSGQWFSTVVMTAVLGLLVFPMHYELQDDALVVRAGLIRYRRAYADITAAKPNRSPFSAPALSLDRLLISSKRGLGVNISPANREAFITALIERAPHLVRTEDGGLAS